MKPVMAGSYIEVISDLLACLIVQSNHPSTNDGIHCCKVNRLLQVVRVLVSPNNPNQATAACQRSMQQCGECGRGCEVCVGGAVGMWGVWEWACGVSVGGAVGCVEVGMWVGVEIPVLHMGWYDRVSNAINLICEI